MSQMHNWQVKWSLCSNKIWTHTCIELEPTFEEVSRIFCYRYERCLPLNKCLDEMPTHVTIGLTPMVSKGYNQPTYLDDILKNKSKQILCSPDQCQV